jgi:hypothetical protein
VFLDRRRIIYATLEHRRGAPEDFPAILARRPGDRGDIVARQVLERAPGETAQLNARQFEFAHKCAEDRQVLRNFIGDERERIWECHRRTCGKKGAGVGSRERTGTIRELAVESGNKRGSADGMLKLGSNPG